MNSIASLIPVETRIATLESAVSELLKIIRALSGPNTVIPAPLPNPEDVHGLAWLDSDETCRRISRHKNTLNRWRKTGKIPPSCWERRGYRYNYREAWVHGFAGKVGF